MEIIEFMKKSRIIGGQNVSSTAKKQPIITKLHNYFSSKIMVSLVNTEISIEDSEVSVFLLHSVNHLQKIHGSKDDHGEQSRF